MGEVQGWGWWAGRPVLGRKGSNLFSGQRARKASLGEATREEQGTTAGFLYLLWDIGGRSHLSQCEHGLKNGQDGLGRKEKVQEPPWGERRGWGGSQV